MDWEAFAYWARPALGSISRLTIKIQQLFIEHPELQEHFGAVAA
jgi:hypothetical protein